MPQSPTLCEYCRKQKDLSYITYNKTLFEKIYVGRWLCGECKKGL